MVQVSKVSFEYVDFHAKMSLIFYPAFGNSITKRTLMQGPIFFPKSKTVPEHQKTFPCTKFAICDTSMVKFSESKIVLKVCTGF